MPNGNGPALSLLIAICDRGKGEKAAALFRGRQTPVKLMALGKGTANSKILNYLGLGQTEKTLLFSVMSYMDARDTLSQMAWTLDLDRPGQGIAFMLPLTAACVKKTVKILSQTNIREEKRGDGDEVEDQFEYALIVAVANRGYNQEVMDAARAAKAAGGTIVNARGFSLAGEEKFFGVNLQPEKEILMILAPRERRNDIMEAIAEKAGAGSPADAITFSLSVSDVEGLQEPSLLPETEDRK
jgi:nitrogen regulatory protein PII